MGMFWDGVSKNDPLRSNNSKKNDFERDREQESRDTVLFTSAVESEPAPEFVGPNVETVELSDVIIDSFGKPNLIIPFVSKNLKIVANLRYDPNIEKYAVINFSFTLHNDPHQFIVVGNVTVIKFISALQLIISNQMLAPVEIGKNMIGFSDNGGLTIVKADEVNIGQLNEFCNLSSAKNLDDIKKLRLVGLKEDIKKITILKFDKMQSLFVYNFLNFVYSHYFMFTKVFGKKEF